MTNSTTFIAAVGMMVLAGAIAACNKTPTSPERDPPGPGPGPSPTTVRLEVGAITDIAPGESVQLTANAIKSDGSIENVTGQAMWTTSNAPVVEVSASGVVRGIAVGEAILFARYHNQGASRATLVVPTGTFRLSGRVSEHGFGLGQVTVSVISGVGEGLTAITTATGEYSLYGVKGPIRLQMKKDNYQNRIEALDVAGHQTFDLEVTPDRPRPDLTGSYVLHLAAARCRADKSSLPAAAANRSYSASIAQDGFRLSVTLSDADFIVTGNRGNRFTGFVDAAGGVTFAIVGDTLLFDDPYYYFGDQDVVERFGTKGALLVSGMVTATATPSRISGVLKGAIAVADGVAPPFAPIFETTCWADVHTFDLRRR